MRNSSVYSPIHPASRPQNPAKRGKPHLTTAKTAVLPSLAISSKRGHRQGVPGWLRRSREIGVFPPHLGDRAAKHGGLLIPVSQTPRLTGPIGIGHGYWTASHCLKRSGTCSTLRFVAHTAGRGGLKKGSWRGRVAWKKMPRPDSRREASGSVTDRGRRRKAPVYSPVRPASRPQNPETGGKQHWITAKAAILSSLMIWRRNPVVLPG
jgi:hypothetical protein